MFVLQPGNFLKSLVQGAINSATRSSCIIIINKNKSINYHLVENVFFCFVPLALRSAPAQPRPSFFDSPSRGSPIPIMEESYQERGR